MYQIPLLAGVLLVVNLSSCYKKSTDVCPVGPQDRTTNVIYQAHWPLELITTSHYGDSVFIYRYIDDFELISSLDSGGTLSETFEPYQRYVVYINQPDSLIQAFDSLIDISVTYHCPAE